MAIPRRRGLAAVVLVTSLALTSCSGQADNASEKNKDSKGSDKVVLASAMLPESLNPLSGYGGGGISKINQGLYTIETVKEGTGSSKGADRSGAPKAMPKLVPLLAEGEPETKDKGKSYTVTLKDGVKFTDGTDLDASDIVATYEAILDPKVGSPLISDMGEIEKVEADGDNKVVFTFKTAMADVKPLLMVGIAPSEHIKKGETITESEMNRKPIGTGPYKVEEFKPGRYVLVSNPDYFMGEPALKRIESIEVKDDAARAQRMTSGEFNGTIDGVQEKRTLSNTVGSMTAIPGQPSISGLENVKRTGDLSGSIAGKPTGLGTDGSVAPVGGTKQTFQFFVKNTGDALLAAPIVTLPNGKKLPIKNVAIKPNGTGSFTVDYDVPKGNGALNFDVSLGKAELSPSSTVSFRYSQSSQADSVPDSFGYPTDKPVTVEQDHTVKSPKPKDAPKDTKYRIDRTANPNLPWASVDPNTGVVTLSPKADVVPGNYEVPVEATFPDGSKRTITLPVLVTGENPSDRMKEAEEAAKQAQDAANNAQETANQALKDLATERERVNDLTDRVNKAEKGLKDARERVGALEKENKAQQKEIDQAKKDVKDLQDKTKKLRAELDDAKKRVATLEEQNKKQQAQIDKLARENKKQQGEIDALKKENAKQQKLIEGLRKDLTAAEKRISTLETELAQTRLELAAVSERLGVVEDRLNTGLGKCVGTIGGSLAALVPAVLLASQFAGGSHMAQVDTSISNFQRQLGMFNPEVAKFVDQNRGAIAAGFAGLGILALLFVPGTCGDDSLGGAIAEPLSSAIDKRKAERENGEGTTAGSSLKIGDGADAGSSNKDKEDAA